QLVDFGERQSDVVARRVQCRRPPDLPLGLVVAALPQLHQSEVRVAQRLIGRQRDDLAKRRFRLSELLAPQVREAERPRRGDGGGAAAPGFSLRNVAREVGIDFVHHAPTLDPRIDNIAPLVASLGAAVSVSDVNNDGWPDLYFTNSKFGFPNALYLNHGDGT